MKRVDPVADLPGVDASGKDWVLWVRSLDYHLSRDLMQKFFSEAWRQRGSARANNDELRDFLKTKGIQLGMDWQEIVLNDARSFFDDPFGIDDGMRRLGWIALGVIVLVLLFLGFLIWQVGKNPERYARMATLMVPQTRAAAVAGNLLQS